MIATNVFTYVENRNNRMCISRANNMAGYVAMPCDALRYES